MGYYSGNGIVTGGGESIRPIKNLWWYGAHSLLQKAISSTLSKPGVSLSTAQGEHASSNLLPVADGSGNLAWVLYDVRGTRTSVSYSQIGGSNLYELNVTTETLSVKYAGGNTVAPNENNWQ